MTDSEPTAWFLYNPKSVGLKDEEGPPTLRGLGPTVASVTPTAFVSPLPAPITPASAPTIAPPRRRRSLLLLGAAFASSVATMFVLGWWQGSRHGPLMAPATATSEPGRALLRKPVRTLAPSAGPSLQPQVARPARTHSAIAMPRPEATTGAVAAAYEPMDL